MIPYAKHDIDNIDLLAVDRVLHSDRLTQGPQVEAFEAEFAKYCGAKYCVAVNSGTAALHLAYLACGVGPGTTVLTSPVTFVATANAALYCGAKVVFGDVDRSNGLLNAGWHVEPGGYDVVVPVSLGGNPLWAETFGRARDIYDFCHGPFGIPPEGSAACFSFHPCKHIAAGEGGAVVTNDPGVAEQCRLGRNHGRAPILYDKSRWVMDEMGFNYRMPELSGALARSQLKRLDWNIQRRREIAAQYDEAFNGKVSTVRHGDNSARHLYQVLVDNNNTTRQQLRTRGVGSQIHYSPIVPLQPYYRERFGYEPGQWPNAEWFSDHALTIPLYPSLTEQEIETVTKAVLDVCSQ